MQARRTRTYSSTLYILHTFHRVANNSIEGGGGYSFQTPLLSARPRLAGPLLLRPLQPVLVRYLGVEAGQGVQVVGSFSFPQQEAQRITAVRGFIQDEGQSIGGRVFPAARQPRN